MSPKKQKRIVDKGLIKSITKLPCCICGLGPPSDPSHIKTVKTFGPDTEWNVYPKCRPHHTEWGALGVKTFCEKYPEFEKLLLNNGWEWLNGKLFHHESKLEF